LEDKAVKICISTGTLERIRSCDHPVHALAVYVTLAELGAGGIGGAVLEQKRIAEHAHMGRTTAQRALAELQAAGLVRIWPRGVGAQRLANEYDLRGLA
jgi:DNA-binding MarR family transcriptional regulator